MFARILAVARMNAWEFLYGKALFMYFCLLAFALAFPSGGYDYVPQLLSACSMGVWVAALLALNSVFDETRQRTLATVMVRPIARWEYLAGRALALVGLFMGFVLLSVALALGLSGGAVQGAHLQQFLTHAVQGATWIVLVLPLAALLKPWPCASLLLGLKLLNFVVHKAGSYSALLAALQPIFVYASLTEVSTVTPWIWVATLVDNLAYAVAVFLACLWIYERQDVRLRES